MLHIKIVPDNATEPAAFGGLGSLEIRTNLLQLGSVDHAAVDSHLSIGGRQYVITSVDLHPGGDEQAVTLTVAPADQDPFEETREEKQPEW
ncbi:MAG TPA: hypothetical protein VHL09_02340 [Dehalococcoidia bacterium]|nr:hypothetical protein [Dehalococcoidia bacterium]